MILSTNAIRIVITILSLVGIEISEDMAIDAVLAITLLITLGRDIINQIKRPNTKYFFFKK